MVFKAGYRQRRPKMTPVQTVVLIIMGVAVIVLLGVLGILVSNMMEKLNSIATGKGVSPDTIVKCSEQWCSLRDKRAAIQAAMRGLQEDDYEPVE